MASTIVGRMGGRAWTASDTRLRRQRQCQSIWQLGLFFELLNELDRHHDLGLSFDARLAKCAHLKADLLYALGYLDLVDESWRVVEIDARGRQIISNPPVHFFPPKGLRGLPPPKRINIGTGIRKLQALVNVTGDAFIMYVSWMFACLWPSGPYTILVLTGEHGTAKTTAAEVARESRS